MTVKELIDRLQQVDPDYPVMVLIPETVLDDGYVESYRRCEVIDLYVSREPYIFIGFDRDNGVVE